MKHPIEIVTVKTPAGASSAMSMQSLIAEGVRAYITRRPPPVHLVGCGDDIQAANTLHLVTYDPSTGFDVATALVLSAQNRSALDRGRTPTAYPIRAEEGLAAALAVVAEYRRAAKAERSENRNHAGISNPSTGLNGQ